MTTFIKASLQKSDYQTNIDEYRVAANITRDYIISKMVKINMFKKDVLTFWSGLKSCYALYIVPNCIRNHHTEFENDETILTCLYG